MPELVGKVEEDEKIELMELVEKKSALENLKLLDLNKEKSEKVEKELQNIQFLIQNWWNNKSEKFLQWKKISPNFYRFLCPSKCIFLI